MGIESVRLEALRPFSMDGRVWRAFGSVICAAPGSLLLVPVWSVRGDLREGVVDGCPVPWQEVWAALDAPPGPQAKLLAPEGLGALAPRVARVFAPYGWVRDTLPAAGTVPTMERVISPDGVRWVWIDRWNSG